MHSFLDKNNTDTLSALLLAQKEKKTSFKAEIENKRALLKKR